MGEDSFHNRTPQDKAKNSSTSNNGAQEQLEDLAENLDISEQHLEEVVAEINEEDLTPEEYLRLDHQLDELFSALDDIENKNDNIHSQLLQLLQDNRDIRKELQKDNHKESETDAEQGPAPKNDA